MIDVLYERERKELEMHCIKDWVRMRVEDMVAFLVQQGTLNIVDKDKDRAIIREVVNGG